MSGIDIFATGNDIRETGIIGPQCRERFLPLLRDGPLARLGVEAAGVSRLRGRYVMHRPASSLSVVAGTMAGQALLWTDEGRRFLRPGDLLIAPKGVNHRYETIPGRAWKVIWFNIRREIPFDRVCVRRTDSLASLEKDYLDIMQEASVEGFLSEEARMGKESYVAVLMQRMLHSEKRGQEALHEARMQVLWHYVLDDLPHKWTLRDLAKIAGYSPEHLNRICNGRYGASVMKHLTRLRMQHAAHLLGLGTHKVLTIAELCGYDNPFAFSVAFKRTFGVPPRNFLSQ